MTNYKAIVTTSDGRHKIIRGATDMVASFVYAIRKARKSLWVSEDSFMGIALATILSVKFINEYTGEVLLEM